MSLVVFFFCYHHAEVITALDGEQMQQSIMQFTAGLPVIESSKVPTVQD